MRTKHRLAAFKQCFLVWNELRAKNWFLSATSITKVCFVPSYSEHSGISRISVAQCLLPNLPLLIWKWTTNIVTHWTLDHKWSRILYRMCAAPKPADQHANWIFVSRFELRSRIFWTNWISRKSKWGQYVVGKQTLISKVASSIHINCQEFTW